MSNETTFNLGEDHIEETKAPEAQKQGMFQVIKGRASSAKEAVMSHPAPAAAVGATIDSASLGAQVYVGGKAMDELMKLIGKLVPEEHMAAYVDTKLGRVAIAHVLDALVAILEDAQIGTRPSPYVKELSGRELSPLYLVQYISRGMSYDASIQGLQSLEIFDLLLKNLHLDKVKEILSVIPAEESGK